MIEEAVTDYEHFVRRSAMILDLEEMGREEEAEIIRDSLDCAWYCLSLEEQDRLRFNLDEEVRPHRRTDKND